MKNWKQTFAIIWTGQFLSLLTSATANFAIVLWISIETRSAEMLSYGAIAALLPQALLGPVAGVLIDRWNRKRVMITADLFIALCTGVLALLFWLNVAQMWHIFALLALRSVGSAFHMPAMQASVPLIAPKSQLTRVAGISQIINSACNIAGPALGALLIINFKMQLVLMLDVLGAVLACASLLFVTIPNPEKIVDRIPNVFREMKEGIAAITGKRGLGAVFLYSVLCMLFLMPVSVLFPLMTLEHFRGDELQVSLIEILYGVGMLIGGAIMGAKVYKVNRVGLINAMYLIVGVVFVIPGLLSPDMFVWFAVTTALGGIAGAVYNSAFTAIVQTNVEPEALGRVFSIFYTFSMIPSMIGLVGIGFFAEYLGVANSFVMCGAVMFAIGIMAFLTPSAMRLDRQKN